MLLLRVARRTGKWLRMSVCTDLDPPAAVVCFCREAAAAEEEEDDDEAPVWLDVRLRAGLAGFLGVDLVEEEAEVGAAAATSRTAAASGAVAAAAAAAAGAGAALAAFTFSAAAAAAPRAGVRGMVFRGPGVRACDSVAVADGGVAGSSKRGCTDAAADNSSAGFKAAGARARRVGVWRLTALRLLEGVCLLGEMADGALDGGGGVTRRVSGCGTALPLARATVVMPLASLPLLL